MKKALATVALAAGFVSLSACGPGYQTVANNNYCVNAVTGQVMSPLYCQVGYTGYNPMMYDYWIGPTYGHSYGVGTVIQHNYFMSGRQVKPTDSAGRKAAGIPVSGSVSNGAKSTTTTRTNSSTPAKPQNSPSPSGVSGRTSTSTTPKATTFGSSGSSSRSSSSFGSSGSTSRSSSSFGSSGGRK